MIELEQYKQELNSYTDRLEELAKSFHIEETESKMLLFLRRGSAGSGFPVYQVPGCNQDQSSGWKNCGQGCGQEP